MIDTGTDTPQALTRANSCLYAVYHGGCLFKSILEVDERESRVRSTLYRLRLCASRVPAPTMPAAPHGAEPESGGDEARASLSRRPALCRGSMQRSTAVRFLMRGERSDVPGRLMVEKDNGCEL